MLKSAWKWFLGVFLVCATGVLFITTLHMMGDNKFIDTARAFYPPQAEFLSPDESGFSVALVSDTGSNNHVLEKVIDDIVSHENEFEFVMHLGDFSTRRTRMGLYWLLYEILPHLRGMPMWGTAGNHDVAHYRESPNTSIWEYRDVLNSAQYWFSYGNVLFVVLDTSAEKLTPDQFDWLDKTLKIARPAFAHCVIITHKPPIDLNPEWSHGHTMAPSDVKKFQSIISKYKIDAMFFGHVHYFAHSDFSGIPIYSVPSSGQYVRDKENKNFGWLELNFYKNGKINVVPHYIDFQGDKRESLEFFAVKYIFTGYLISPVVIMLITMVISMIIGAALYVIAKRNRTQNI